VNRKKDEEMSCQELYESYDLSEKQQRKWLVKISRYWLEKSKDEETNKVVIETLDIVERYIKGQATKEDLQKAAGVAWAAVVVASDPNFAFNSALGQAAAWAITYAFDAADTAYAALAFAHAAVWPTDYAYTYSAAGYKKMLLEIINEMDEFERIIRRKT